MITFQDKTSPFILFCCDCVDWFSQYSSVLIHWHWRYQSWRMWVDKSYESDKNDNITKTKQKISRVHVLWDILSMIYYTFDGIYSGWFTTYSIGYILHALLYTRKTQAAYFLASNSRCYQLLSGYIASLESAAVKWDPMPVLTLKCLEIKADLVSHLEWRYLVNSTNLMLYGINDFGIGNTWWQEAYTPTKDDKS